MDELQVGVIGTGTMGVTHLRAFSENPRARVVAVCSKEPDRCRELAEQYDIPSVYDSAADLIADTAVQAVCLATPDHVHAEDAIAAAKARKHVLVEKPLATTLHEAAAMVTIAHETDVLLMTQFSHRWIPSYHTVKQRIAGGETGRPLVVSARKNNPRWVPTDLIGWAGGTDPASFLSSHDIDLTLWWLEDEPDRVYAQEVRSVLVDRGIDTPDAIQAAVHFKGGAIATFEACWVYPDTAPAVPDSYMHVVCQNETIKLLREHEQVELMSDKFSYPRSTIVTELDGRLHGALVCSLGHFVDCVLDGREPSITPESSLMVTRILDAIQRSMKTGQVVTF